MYICASLRSGACLAMRPRLQGARAPQCALRLSKLCRRLYVMYQIDVLGLSEDSEERKETLHWKGPIVDVLGVSTCNLDLESEKILALLEVLYALYIVYNLPSICRLTLGNLEVCRRTNLFDNNKPVLQVY